MTNSEKLIKYLNEKPINFDKLDKCLGLHQGTCWRVSKGEAIKHHGTIIEYFIKELSWNN
jgi:hypothetical protein